MKTILITGINGYLGSHLAKTLSTECNIVGLEYSLENLFRIKDLNYKVYSVENGVPEGIFIEQDIDIIIHAATFYGHANEAVKTIANANFFIPFDLLDKAIENNCKLFINTDTVLERFVSPYSLTKRHFQDWLFMRKNAIKVINMQLEHFYGPGCSNSNFITAMINRLKNNENTIDLTLGDQKRDFIYIDDVVSAYMTVIHQAENIPDNYSLFHVSTKQLISIKELMLLLKEITRSTTILNFGAHPYRENELMHSETNNKALTDLGWKSKYKIQDGIKFILSNA